MKRCLSCQHLFQSVEWRCPCCNKAPTLAGDIPLFAPELTDTDVNYDPGHFARIAAVQDNNFWFRSRSHLIAEFIGTWFPEARRFLELGAGTGVVHAAIAKQHPQLELHSSEMLLSGVRQAAHKLGGSSTLYQLDARNLPFENEFDLIGAFRVIGAEVLHGLVGEDDAPAERVARIVALEHDDIVPRIAQLHGDGEDQSGRAAADAGDTHDLVYI